MHTSDYFKSGIIKNENEIREGMLRANLFFAISHEMAPMFFSPKHILKYGQFDEKSNKKIMELLKLKKEIKKGIIIYSKKDKEMLENHSFSLYEFNKTDFKEIPTGEFISEIPVAPINETRKFNVVNETKLFGIHVEFVEDYDAFIAELKAK